MSKMWVRSGFWTGAPKAGSADHFQRQMDEVLIPALQALPGVRSACALWPRQLQGDAQPIACQVLLVFDDRSALDRMFDSAERKALQPVIAAALALFDGAVSHIDSEVAGAV